MYVVQIDHTTTMVELVASPAAWLWGIGSPHPREPLREGLAEGGAEGFSIV
jgi:hypothetical protein